MEQAIAAAIERCLAPDPGDRFASCRALAVQLYGQGSAVLAGLERTSPVAMEPVQSGLPSPGDPGSASPTTDLQGNGFRCQRVCSNGTGWSVLFGGSERDDHALASFEVVLHLGPAAQGKPDVFRCIGGAWIAGGHRWLGIGLMIAQLGLDQ